MVRECEAEKEAGKGAVEDCLEKERNSGSLEALISGEPQQGRVTSGQL